MPPETKAPNENELARFGYRQELNRELGWFSSFALSFSIVAVTTGLFATYGAGLQTAGPAFIWWRWSSPSYPGAFPYPDLPINGLGNSAAAIWHGGRDGS